MGNANGNGREEQSNTNNIGLVNGSLGQPLPVPDYPNPNPNPNPSGFVGSDPDSPLVPPIFTPQLPVAPLQRGNGHLFFNDMRRKESQQGAGDHPPEKGIPTIVTWSFGGNNISVEGSWDNWTSRKVLQRSGKDHTILLVLPSGIYHYKFIVDGETRYMPDLPHVSSELGQVCNVLDVHDYVPESLDSIAEFEPPASPTSSYGHAFPSEDDFAKDPVSVPPQLNVTVLGMQNSGDASLTRPQHVVLNHLFIEKGWAASQSVVSLGLTQRFESKYVTLVLYKPLKR